VTQVGPADAADRPAEPVSSRRPEERAESARSLLLTVLGELVLPAGGTAWTSSLIEVMARLGFEEKACRQALLRMASAGWLVPERVGRRTRWTLTPGALRSLAGGTDRIFGFARFSPDWDRQWLLVLVLARAPEADHRARHVLRSRLAWLGLGSPMPGVWISTHTERADEVQEVLRQAGVIDDARIFTGRYLGGGAISELAGQAWDLAAIDESYRQFASEFDTASRGQDPVAAVIRLVHAWRRFPRYDPALPAELLPATWAGCAATALFRRRYAAWSGDARLAWTQLESHAH
jgi:phenylacetic acid degradation operon negative regulatory protein